MNETLTPEEAARAFAKANAWEDRIQHRTEGMTWMVWGLVTAAIWVTFQALSRGPMTLATMTLAWAPWILAGFALTHALWRSASLASPAVHRPAWWTYLAKLGGIAAGIVLLSYVIHPQTPAYPLAIMGMFWIATALLNRRWSKLGKATSIVIGALVILGGLALPLLTGDMGAMMLGAAAIGGAVPLAGGFWQTLRG